MVLWAAGIFYFSSRSYPLGPLSRSEQGEVIGHVAHFVEYAGLAALLYRALSSPKRTFGPSDPFGPSGSSDPPALSAPSDPSASEDPGVTTVSSRRSTVVGRPSFVSFAIALAYAILDELHQELVPGRGFELADIGYDMLGMTAALGLMWVRERG